MAIAVDVPAVDDVSYAGYDARTGIALTQQRLELLGRINFRYQLVGEALEVDVRLRICD